MTLKEFFKLWQEYESMPRGERELFVKQALRLLQSSKKRTAVSAN